MKTIQIREATVSDIDIISHVHVQCWQEAYAEILPADYLNSLSREQRAEKWKKAFHEEKSPWKMFVAEEDGLIKGFVSSGRSLKSDFGFQGELYTLYLLRQLQGRGMGRALFEKARNSLALSGINKMYLWVFKDNPALAFYKHMGGEEFMRQTVHIGGADVEEIAMVWPEKDMKGT